MELGDIFLDPFASPPSSPAAGLQAPHGCPQGAAASGGESLELERTFASLSDLSFSGRRDLSLAASRRAAPRHTPAPTVTS